MTLSEIDHVSFLVEHAQTFFAGEGPGGTFFEDWLLVKKCSSIDAEMPEKAVVSVFKSHLVNFGSFKRHILYFCASIVEKIRSH